MDLALQHCGFNAQTRQYLIGQGFDSPDALLLASESDLDTIARAITRAPPRGMAQVAMPFIAL
jgi:hypothetical protein